ncbi:MAG TPA: GNAT family N-acetyltransferase [Puia sp.]|nr:GNAT family N-acetyltransferase [Puia sp.]
MILYNSEKIGYGSIKGNENISDRDTVFEFYIVPSHRKLLSLCFLELLHSSKAGLIECQSNDFLLTTLLYEFGHDISSNVILFEDRITSELTQDKILFRKRAENDLVFEHKAEPVGDYILEFNKEVVATGGFLLHYNMPFADLYMEVREDCRKKGFGSFLIQELKKQCYLNGRVPAARTDKDNIASKATLIKAGLKIAAFMLLGSVKHSEK